MKVLDSTQQTDLQEAVALAAGDVSDTALRATLTYWAIELRPKRVRKKPILVTLDVLDTRGNPLEVNAYPE